MTLPKEQRVEILSKFRAHESDTGSPEVQIALLSARIATLTEHFKVHKKDHAGRRGLLKLVSRRRSLLNYLQNKSEDRYKKTISDLGLRK